MDNNRPDTATLDITIKDAHSTDVAIPKSQTTQHHHREAPEVYTLERRACKNVATENGLHNTASAIHSGYYSTQTT